VPSWRGFSWFILVVQVPFAIWLFGSLVSSDTKTTCPQGQFEEFCHAGEAIGTTVAVAFILLIWALVDVILGVCWMVTNDNKMPTLHPTKDCPDCAEEVPGGAGRPNPLRMRPLRRAGKTQNWIVSE
jgi:hypothetical protein